MSKEKYNQIIDEVYKNYFLIKSMEKGSFGISGLILPKEEFINNCKTNTEFSEKWGLKIEERIVLEQVDQTNPTLKGSTALYSRKLITLTYNNETIESYE